MIRELLDAMASEVTASEGRRDKNKQSDDTTVGCEENRRSREQGGGRRYKFISTAEAAWFQEEAKNPAFQSPACWNIIENLKYLFFYPSAPPPPHLLYLSSTLGKWIIVLP